MIRTALTTLALAGPVLLLLLTCLRAVSIFSFVGRLVDGGERAIESVMQRVTHSLGTATVSIIVDLEAAQEGESAVPILRSYLAQDYRNLEVVVLVGDRGIPTEVGLAFDLVEASSDHGITVHRSRREDRLMVVSVAATASGPDEGRWTGAVQASSGDLVLPLDLRWNLRAGAITDLASAWVRHPRSAACLGVLHPQDRFGAASLVSVRADLMATAGLGDGQYLQAGLGLLAGGYEGCIIGMLRRDVFLRVGGLSGPLVSPRTWAALGDRLRIDGEERNLTHRVEVVAKPLGLTDSGRRDSLAGMGRERASIDGPILRLLVAASTRQGHIRAAYAVSTAAAVIGLVTGQVGAEALWFAATVPVLSAVVVILGLMMDDRALRPVGTTRARLDLLTGAVGAALWGTSASPFATATATPSLAGGPAGEFDRA